jgi:beta-lactamase regulating signal transducer with metallopeptidase domain
MLSYPGRMICVAVVIAGVVHGACELAVWVMAPAILRRIESMQARRRERMLYLLQLMPMLSALIFTGAFCVPEYLRNETNLGSETVSPGCVLAAAAVLLWYGVTAIRSAAMALRTLSFLRACRRVAAGIRPNRSRSSRLRPTPVLSCPAMNHGVALVGLFRPVILISEDLTGERGLSNTALEIALDHEQSHAEQLDNWKLFSLHLLPTLGLRLPDGHTWMELWQSAAEWAADDDAARGDRTRLLLLAETLIAVARGSGSSPAILSTALTCSEADLAVRVDRLLAPSPSATTGAARGWYARWAWALAAVLAILLAAAINSTMLSAHLSEHVLHLR